MMTAREGLAIAYAHAQLVRAMEFEQFADCSKAPEGIQMMEFLLGEYTSALDYYVGACDAPTEENINDRSQ